MTAIATLFQIFLISKKEYRTARQTLLFDSTFDLPNSAKSDYLIGLKMMFRTIVWVHSPTNSPKKLDNWGRIIAIDGVEQAHKSNREFCMANQIKPFDVGIDYQKLFQNASTTSKLRGYFICLLLSLWIVPVSIFLRNRANLALIIRYGVQIDFIGSLIYKHEISKVYDFAAYSNASNWTTLVFNKLGARVFKIPSIVPLAAHLSNIVADEIAISTPYHRDEYEYFKLQETVSIVKHTLPKHSDYLDKYRSERPKAKKNIIGYYSHASWLRASHDHGESQFGLPHFERTLLSCLSNIIDSDSQLELFVFTHPRERHTSVIENTRNYYHSIIGSNERVKIYTGQEKSSLIFEQADVGVGTMSSVLFERLLCGYKTLFYTEGMQGFPVPNSSISSVCADNYSTLKALIEWSVKLDEVDFFAKKRLNNYKLDSNFYR